MLEIAKTSTLGMMIVCRECKHTESSDVPESAIWIDDGNGDVYYQGEDKESLVAFLFHHG